MITETNKTAPRISRAIQQRMLKLLNMEYKPAEIADELQVKPKAIYRLIDLGAPHRTDKNGNIWIIGKDFRVWAESQLTLSREKPKEKMGKDQAWCTHCRRPVSFDTTIKRQKKRMVIIYGICKECGGKVARFSSPKDIEE